MHETHRIRKLMVPGMLLIPLLTTMAVGCDSRPPAGQAKQETVAEAKKEMPAGESKDEKGTMTVPAAGDTALMAPVASPGRTANDEGVTHAQQGHWDVAESHFRTALEADPNLAEAQYNLGLALDKQDKHEAASAAFKKAAEMAPGDIRITESPILKKHTST